jgi:predicted phage-related endonuclease
MNDFTYLKDPDFSQGRHYIGASDIPTLALLNLKYNQTPLSLWEEKTGRAEPFQGNERTKAGKELEPLILKWGLEKIDFNVSKSILKNYYEGKKQIGPLHFFTEARHPDRSYIVSHADLVNTNGAIMEAKSTGFFGAKRTDDINIGYDKDDMSANGIPSSVFLQIQTQMLCYGIDQTYVSVMIDTGQHRLYGPIQAHKKTQEKILALAERFWWYVEKDTPPKPETWKDVIKLNPVLDKESKTVISGPELIKVEEMKERAKMLREKEKEIKKEMEDIKNAIGLVIGKNKYLESPTGDSLANASESTRYFLKDYKNMSKTRLTRMIKDGFINKTDSRTLRF